VQGSEEVSVLLHKNSSETDKITHLKRATNSYRITCFWFAYRKYQVLIPVKKQLSWYVFCGYVTTTSFQILFYSQLTKFSIRLYITCKSIVKQRRKKNYHQFTLHNSRFTTVTLYVLLFASKSNCVWFNSAKNNNRPRTKCWIVKKFVVIGSCLQSNDPVHTLTAFIYVPPQFYPHVTQIYTLRQVFPSANMYSFLNLLSHSTSLFRRAPDNDRVVICYITQIIKPLIT
jgi:hypothetical protein